MCKRSRKTLILPLTKSAELAWTNEVFPYLEGQIQKKTNRKATKKSQLNFGIKFISKQYATVTNKLRRELSLCNLNNSTLMHMRFVWKNFDNLKCCLKMDLMQHCYLFLNNSIKCDESILASGDCGWIVFENKFINEMRCFGRQKNTTKTADISQTTVNSNNSIAESHEFRLLNCLKTSMLKIGQI